MRRLLLWLPLVFFAGLLLVVASGLFKPADRAVHSAMVGKSLPPFELPGIVPGKAGLSGADFATGEPRLLNVFASWCVPCITEAPVLIRLKQAGVHVEGIAVRDTAADLMQFLARNGDAYDRIGSDRESRVQLSIGGSGVPESFVIDGKGRIVMQHIGDIEAGDIPAIVAAVDKAR